MELECLESISGIVYSDLGVSIVPRGCVSAPNPLPLKHIRSVEPGVSRLIGLISKSSSVKACLLESLKLQLVEAALKGRL
jgi:hypothetical protein